MSGYRSTPCWPAVAEEGRDVVKKGLSALAALAIAGSAQARELRVSQTDPGAYHTVQAAIEALPVAGGDIAIAPGTYREKLTVVRNGVHLHGSGKRAGDVVLVYGDAAATAGGTFKSATLTASGDDFRLANLTVQNDYWLDPQHPPSQAVALSVMREGWREWTPGTTHRLLTATYAEYRSVGAGANPATRESYSHQLTADEARAWRLSAFFGGVTDWIGTRP